MLQKRCQVIYDLDKVLPGGVIMNILLSLLEPHLLQHWFNKILSEIFIVLLSNNVSCNEQKLRLPEVLKYTIN